jgi:predicted DNA-binding transcriptional regulator AlpA
MAEVRQLVGLGTSSIYKRISEGLFPAPLRSALVAFLGACGTYWRGRAAGMRERRSGIFDP